MKKISRHTLFVGVWIGVVITIGMLSYIMPYVLKPSDRGYTGLSGFVDDYIGYTSYIKEGMSGRGTVAIRSLPKTDQAPTTVHLTYIWIGKLLGIFGFSAPFAYHVSRAIFGAVFLFLMWRLFLALLGDKTLALLATIVASVNTGIGWYEKVQNQWVYHALAPMGFRENIALRFTSRPHYLLGGVLFVFLMLLMWRWERIVRGHHGVILLRTVLLLVISIVLGTIHPAFSVLLFATAGSGAVYRLVCNKSLRLFIGSSFIVCATGLALGMSISYWGTHQYPFNTMLSFEEYVYYEKLSWVTILGDLGSFGPTLWVGIPGLILAVLAAKGKDKRSVMMLVWLLVQIALFFSLYPLFRAERVRFIQSLYFIPMAYGTVVVVREIYQRFGKHLAYAVIACIILLNIPAIIQGTIESITYHTNLTYFNPFVFPSQALLAGYRYLDTKTPRESVVVAHWEAANNILLYSHNFVVGNTQGWSKGKGNEMMLEKSRFAEGTMTERSARSFVQANNISYLFLQGGERNVTLPYSFIKQVFANDEVTIYEVGVY